MRVFVCVNVKVWPHSSYNLLTLQNQKITHFQITKTFTVSLNSSISDNMQNVFWQTAFGQNVIWQTAIGQYVFRQYVIWQNPKIMYLN